MNFTSFGHRGSVQRIGKGVSNQSRDSNESLAGADRGMPDIFCRCCATEHEVLLYPNRGQLVEIQSRAVQCHK